jgi:hypothetical protein
MELNDTGGKVQGATSAIYEYRDISDTTEQV